MDIRSLKHAIEFFFFSLWKRGVLLLPVRARYKLAEWLALFFYHSAGQRRNITLSNLYHAFPDKKEDEIRRIAKESYKNMAKTFFEYFWLDKIIKSDRIRFSGKDILDDVYAQGRGVILVSLHMGNWELGSMLGSMGYPMYNIAKRQSNKRVDEVINAIRRKNNVQMIYKGDSSRKLVKAVKEKAIIGLVSDQYVKDTEVVFFNRKTMAPSGAAMLALRYDIPVIIGYNIRNKDNTFTAEIVKNLPMEKTGDMKQDVQRITQSITDELEAIIRAHPEQWLWQHRRWRPVN